MDDYKTFANEALEVYKSLPEETNSIYKRRHITLDLDLSNTSDIKDDNSVIERIYKDSIAHLNINFDIMLGKNGIIIKNNPYIRIINNSEPEFYTILKKSMHNKLEDKYVAFTHANADKIIMIDIPEGIKTGLNILFVNVNESLPIMIYAKLGKNSEFKMLQMSASNLIRMYLHQ